MALNVNVDLPFHLRDCFNRSHGQIANNATLVGEAGRVLTSNNRPFRRNSGTESCDQDTDAVLVQPLAEGLPAGNATLENMNRTLCGIAESIELMWYAIRARQQFDDRLRNDDRPRNDDRLRNFPGIYHLHDVQFGDLPRWAGRERENRDYRPGVDLHRGRSPPRAFGYSPERPNRNPVRSPEFNAARPDTTPAGDAGQRIW